VITSFGDFRQFFCTNIVFFFFKTDVMIIFCIEIFLVKNANFYNEYRYVKNDNIHPRNHEKRTNR
jgi:hypothetical protein